MSQSSPDSVASEEPQAIGTPGEVTQKRAPGGTAIPDEDVLDAPSQKTLIMLSVIAATTLIMWGLGRAACNYHPPHSEIQTPRKTTLEERTVTPKGVATEFARAVATGDFETARRLAQGEALAFVQSEETSCGNPCSRRTHVGETSTVTTLLVANSVDHYLITKTKVGGQTAARLLEVERNERILRVTRVLDAAAPVPELKPEPEGSVVISGADVSSLEQGKRLKIPTSSSSAPAEGPSPARTAP